MVYKAYKGYKNINKVASRENEASKVRENNDINVVHVLNNDVVTIILHYFK